MVRSNENWDTKMNVIKEISFLISLRHAYNLTE